MSSDDPTISAATERRHSAPPAPAPRPFEVGSLHRTFTRGREKPRGVVWFGVQSFWGHLRHFVASAIATEDVDSRDWMTADDPEVLTRRIARRIGDAARAGTLTESIGRDVWVDYVADTGDDVAVSRAVAKLIFSPYELPEPEAEGSLRAPRGDILMFGGDTAYPVATAEEIQSRVVGPFNSVLEGRTDNGSRVLMGIPGNHDWYDGLDGFGRLFRRHLDDNPDGSVRPRSGARHPTVLDRTAAWAKEFVRGGKVDKPRALELIGYSPVQGASYFALPIAPGILLLAVDRQLKRVDARQERYFKAQLNSRLAASPWVMLPDPVYAFGARSDAGAGMIESLGLSLQARSHFVMAGDIHHYCRQQVGPTLHVTAGGGGAFLHPAPITPRGDVKAAVDWPDAAQSKFLLRAVPWKIAIGRSGILPHLAFLALFAPILWLGSRWFDRVGLLLLGPALICLVLTLLYALIGGLRHGRKATLALAFAAAAITAGLPVLAVALLEFVFSTFEILIDAWLLQLFLLVVSVFTSAFIFGGYLTLLSRFGYENTQAFTALDHPGFKHFVRLRVRADGSAIDGWCIGLVDPLGADSQPVLVDRFTWRCRE